LQQSDVQAVFALHSDPETVRYWGHELLSEIAEAEALIRLNLEWMAAGDCYYWAIEHAATGEMIGTCTVFKIDDRNRRAELGYILNRNFWRRGLMTEAMIAMIGFSFDTLELHRLEADTDPHNTASNALLEKFGFKHEGYFRERWMVHGKWHDSDMWGLLKSDYLAQQDSA
jgi:RimJ/RimL family protein N-acetyltransferase